MAIYRIPESKYWHASIYQGRGKPRLRTSLGVEDEETAKALERVLLMARRGNIKRDNLVALVDQLIGYDEQDVGMRLDDAFDLYKHLPEVSVSDHTMRVRRQHFTRLVEYCAENWPRVVMMHHVTRDVAFSFADTVREQANRTKTYNNIKNNIQAVFQALLYRANLSENVWKLVPTLKATDALHGRAFTPEEEERLLKAAEGTEWHAVSIVARYTGLRRKDILELRWRDIQDDRISLIPSKTSRHKIKVTIPLHQRVLDALPKRRAREKLLFPALRHEHQRPRDTYRSSFTPILQKAKIPACGAYLSFHCWRHTFRTRLSEARVSQEAAKMLGGWKTDDMAELYNHDWTILREAIDALE